jgi:hypothetical protein
VAIRGTHRCDSLQKVLDFFLRTKSTVGYVQIFRIMVFSLKKGIFWF